MAPPPVKEDQEEFFDAKEERTRKRTMQREIDDSWKGGPYRVEKVRHPDVTAVHLENRTRLTVHADCAKLFRESKTLSLRRNDQVQMTSEDRREDFVVEDV